MDDFKVGDIVICIDIKDLDSYRDIKLQQVSKVKMVNDHTINTSVTDYGYGKWRFRKATVEDIVKAKLLGLYYG